MQGLKEADQVSVKEWTIIRFSYLFWK